MSDPVPSPAPARTPLGHGLPPFAAEGSFGPARAALPDLVDAPLRGVTVLAVEDSRFASEALRLMCRRSGARLRRAETLEAARAHLRLYRPDVVIVDLGLPDGRGEVLIRDLVLRAPRPPVIFGTSGQPQGRATALAAGADGFLDKPLESLGLFQSTLLRHLGADPFAEDAVLSGEVPVTPDPLALKDDLTHAADLIDTALDRGGDAAAERYVAGFLMGIARAAHDAPLAAAAGAHAAGQPRLVVLRDLLAERLGAETPAWRDLA